MKQTTKMFLGIAATSFLVIGASSGVLAQGGVGPGWGGHQGMMGGGMHRMSAGAGPMMVGDPVALTTERLGALKEKLKITAEQEGAWQTYADAVQAQAGLMAAHRQVMHSGTLSADQHQTFHQQGLEQMQKLSDATGALLAVLTPEQQVRADGLLGRHWAAR